MSPARAQLAASQLAGTGVVATGVVGTGVVGTGQTAVTGDRPPLDPRTRRRVLHAFGPARELHLGDLLGTVRRLRALAADPFVDLTVRIEGPAREAALTAAALVACGLGSVAFTGGVTPLDLDGARDTGPDAGLGISSGISSGAEPVVKDLRRPRVPMGQVTVDGEPDLRGVVQIMDSPLRVAAAIRQAHTDLDPTLGYDPQLRPGVANLAVILGLLTDRTPIAALFGLHGTHELKRAITEALLERLRPIRAVYTELIADPVTLDRLVQPSP